MARTIHYCLVAAFAGAPATVGQCTCGTLLLESFLMNFDKGICWL